MELAPKSHGHAPRSVVAGVVVGWILIALKCTLLPGVFQHWQVPVHPGWVIVPTLVFAGLVTVLIATHDWEKE
ncbi:MAG: hypothetical protein IAE82_00525 [Opitutaceae bacterium]|nr:hypothetical protein [Opitutaceae bacterium]